MNNTNTNVYLTTKELSKRWKAAGEMLGVEEVPVMIIRGLNPAQKARLLS